MRAGAARRGVGASAAARVREGDGTTCARTSRAVGHADAPKKRFDMSFHPRS